MSSEITKEEAAALLENRIAFVKVGDGWQDTLTLVVDGTEYEISVNWKRE